MDAKSAAIGARAAGYKVKGARVGARKSVKKPGCHRKVVHHLRNAKRFIVRERKIVYWLVVVILIGKYRLYTASPIPEIRDCLQSSLRL